MKKLFILAAAIVAFASCSKEEPQAIVQTSEICFAPAATQTRAAVTAVGNTKALQDNGFAVFGFQGEAPIFENTKVVYNSDAITSLNLKEGSFGADLWAPEKAADVRYWAVATYKFSGVYPATDNGYSMDKDGNQTITNFVNDGTVDLLVSNVETVNNTANKKTAVALQFEHMLSRVKFTFKNGFSGNEVIEIKDVVIYGVGKQADAKITGTTPAPDWTIENDSRIDIDFGTMDSETAAKRFNKAGKDTTCYKYIIPGEEQYTMGFTLTVYSEGVQVATKTYSATTNNAITVKPNAAFAAGKGYNFTATISPDEAGDIFPIQFSVDVTDWAEDEEGTLDLK
jgi:hypothetical protein